MADNILIDRLIVGRTEPHIYAFETGTVPNYLKIGDTYRPVETRLDEWRRYFADLQKRYDEPAVAGMKYFRDLSVHHYLIDEKGRKRLERTAIPNLPYYSNEFFENATVEDIEDAVKDIRKSAADKDGRYKLYSMEDGRMPVDFHYERGKETLPLRPNQEEVVRNFMSALKHGRTHLLMYAVMRFGKSFTAMSCAKKMKAQLVVVVSAKADVKTEWKKTVEGIKNFEGYEFADSDNLSRDYSLVSKAQAAGKKLVVCLTLQDLCSNEIKERHKDLFSNRIDLLIVDETHFGARAEHYGKVLPPVSSKPKQESKYDADSIDAVEEQVKQLNAKIQLHLSGTPYRILMGDEFSDEDIICNCQFTDIAKASEEWDKANLDTKEEWTNPYYGFPQMVRFAFNLNESALRKLSELQKSGVTVAFGELFMPRSIKKSNEGLHRQFVHKAEILDFLHAIDGSREDTNILAFLDNERIRQGKLCRHIVFVLPYRASCDAMEKMLKEHASEFRNLSQYEIINIAGVEDERRFSKLEKVTRYIAECEGRDQKTITLTVNRMLTGATVPEWDTMLYLKDTASPQEYDQAVFRLQNPYIKTYKDGDGNVIKYNMKPQTLLVDFDPKRMFILQELRAHIYDINTDANGNSNLQNRIARELQVSPIVWMNKNRLQEVTPNNILDAVREYSRERSVLDEATEIPVDHGLSDVEEINKLIMRQQPIGSRGGLKMKPVEDENAGDLDYPDSPSDSGTSENSDGIKPEGEQEKKDNLFDKRYATLCSRILLFAFLTKDRVLSLEEIIHVSNQGKENKRILANLGLDGKMLRLLFKHLNPNVLHQLDYKIQNINSLAHDETLSAIERVENAMRKFGRWSTSEIVTPQFLARRMLNDIPRERVTPSTKFMDIASKEGEFAYAIIQVFGECYKDKIYSIPTSSIAYEFTRKVYEALGMPIENIEDKFNSYDLIGKNAEVYIQKIKKMCIDIAVGNPPYQDEGGSGGTNDAPIYQEFCFVANKNSSQLSTLVIPSKWFTGGREHLLGEFRKEMLQSGQVRSLTNYSIAQELFEDVQIKGGVCYFVRDSVKCGSCVYELVKGDKRESAVVKLDDFNIMIREPKLAQIVKQVRTKAKEEGLGFVDEIISADTPFGIPTNPFKSTKLRLSVVENKDELHDTILYYLKGTKRVTGYIDHSCVEKNKGDIDKYKVFVPAAYGAGENYPHQILGVPEYGGKGSVCSQTYLYATFDSESEARNFIAYLRTRFFRLLVSAIKITQHAQSSVYQFVPMLDLKHKWTDEELCAKFGIEEYKDYIESMIKPMD